MITNTAAISIVDDLRPSKEIATENSARHHSTSEQKSEGAHYTPSNLASFVARQIASRFVPSGARRVSILDPAMGDGELLLALLSALAAQGVHNVEVNGFETNANSAQVASQRIATAFPQATVNAVHGDFLVYAAENFSIGGGSLFDVREAEGFDLVIANPPYVRTQVMGADQAQGLAQQFGLSGRVDLYHAFLHAIGRVLKLSGTAGVIVSNRFMTTKSGAAVRSDLLSQFHPHHVWDLGDTKLFTAAVLPAVLLLERKDPSSSAKSRTGFTTIYSSKAQGTVENFADVLDALGSSGLVETPDGQRFLVEQGTLDCGLHSDDVWRIANDNSNAWMDKVTRNTWATFGDIGDIRVGVKTTADKVFIRSDWHKMPDADRPELMRPLTTHHVARRFRASEAKIQRGIVYPHAVVNGRRTAIDLAAYPRTAKYLEGHRTALESRTYLAGAGRQWYEIWVPQNPDAWPRPKIVFRDICEQPTFWLDVDGSVINGDCYWFTCNPEQNEELLWLALAVGNSTFIEAFYDRRFNNKLYSGRRRFMTQYVEQFPLPDPNRVISKQIIELVKQVYELTPSLGADQLAASVDALVWESFGLVVKEV